MLQNLKQACLSTDAVLTNTALRELCAGLNAITGVSAAISGIPDDADEHSGNPVLCVELVTGPTPYADGGELDADALSEDSLQGGMLRLSREDDHVLYISECSGDVQVLVKALEDRGFVLEL